VGRDNESAAYANAIRKYQDWPFVVIVADSYDLENAVHKIFGGELKQLINSQSGTVFVRPDSGEPVSIVADTIEGLIEHFGYIENSKGYKVLPNQVRVCQGDGITLDSLRAIYEELDRRKLAADNVYFGMGGGLLQHINRDTLHFAQKANAVRINGEWIDIYKTPKTADLKTSKRGRLALRKIGDRYESVPRDSISPEENLLVPVYRNGKLLKRWDFLELIERSERPVPEHYYADVIASRSNPPGPVVSASPVAA
jgi:nicotinamide phosphoribosyltransferase